MSKNKKIISVFLAIITMLTCFPISAFANNIDWEYSVNEDNTIEITGYNGNLSSTLELPKTIDDKTVIGTSSEIFENKSVDNAKTIIIPYTYQFIWNLDLFSNLKKIEAHSLTIQNMYLLNGGQENKYIELNSENTEKFEKSLAVLSKLNESLCENNKEINKEKTTDCKKDGINYICKVCGYEWKKACQEHQYEYVKEKSTKDNCYSECIACGEQIKSNHNYKSEITKAPTCTEEGTRTYTCTNCGYSYAEDIPKTTHDFVRKTLVEATCAQPGTDELTCSRCGYKETETTYKSHEYDDGVVVDEGNCVNVKIKYTCKLCGNTYEETEDVLHDCIIENGYFQCKRCNKKVKLTLNSINTENYTYNFDDVNDLDWDGALNTYVINCNEDSRYTFDFSKLNFNSDHGSVSLVKIDPEFTDDEIILYSLLKQAYPRYQLDKYDTDGRCHPVENAPKLSYDFLSMFSLYDWTAYGWDPEWSANLEDKFEWTENSELQFKNSQVFFDLQKDRSNGKAYNYLEKYGSECFLGGTTKETLSLKKGKYLLVVKNAYSDSCKEPMFTGKFDIKKECNHVYNETITKAPTCNEKGTKTYTCTKCGYSYTEDIPKITHNYKTEITKEPTCTEDGTKTYTCKLCGDSYTEIIPATGHEYKKINIDDKTYKIECSKCGLNRFYKELDDWTITFSGNDNTCTLYKYNGSETILSLPEKVGKYKVLGLEKSAFENVKIADDITEVTIPYTYKKVEGIENLSNLRQLNYHEILWDYFSNELISFFDQNNIYCRSLCEGHWYTDQDCTKQDIDVYCKICGYTEKRDSNMTYFEDGHQYVISNVNGDTITYTCTQCPNSYTMICKHNNAKYDRKVEANCRHGSYDIYVCPDCNSEIKRHEQQTLGEHSYEIKNGKAICKVCQNEITYKSYNIDELNKQYTFYQKDFYDDHLSSTEKKNCYNCVKLTIDKNNTPVYFYQTKSQGKFKIRTFEGLSQDEIDYYLISSSQYGLNYNNFEKYNEFENDINSYLNNEKKQEIIPEEPSIFKNNEPVYLDKGIYYLFLDFGPGSLAISNSPIYKCDTKLHFQNPEDYNIMYNQIAENLPNSCTNEEYKEAFKDFSNYNKAHNFVFYKNEKLAHDITTYQFSGSDNEKIKNTYEDAECISMICENCGEIVYSYAKFEVEADQDKDPDNKHPEKIDDSDHNFVYTYDEPNCIEAGYKKWTCKNSVIQGYVLTGDTEHHSYIEDYIQNKNDIPSDFVNATFDEFKNYYNQNFERKFEEKYPDINSFSDLYKNKNSNNFFEYESNYDTLMNFIKSHSFYGTDYCDKEIKEVVPALSTNHQHSFKATYTANFDGTHNKKAVCTNKGCYSYMKEKELYNLTDSEASELNLNYFRNNNGIWYKFDENGNSTVINRNSEEIVLNTYGKKVKTTTKINETENCIYDDNCTCIYCGAVNHKKINSEISNYIPSTADTNGSYIKTDYCEKCNAIVDVNKIILPKGEITVNVDDNITLKVNKKGTYSASYNIKFNGIDNYSNITFKPKDTLVLVNDKTNESKIAKVSQKQIEFSKDKGLTTTGTVTVESLTEGTWTGYITFDYYFWKNVDVTDYFIWTQDTEKLYVLNNDGKTEEYWNDELIKMIQDNQSNNVWVDENKNIREKLPSDLYYKYLNSRVFDSSSFEDDNLQQKSKNAYNHHCSNNLAIKKENTLTGYIPYERTAINGLTDLGAEWIKANNGKLVIPSCATAIADAKVINSTTTSDEYNTTDPVRDVYSIVKYGKGAFQPYLISYDKSGKKYYVEDDNVTLIDPYSSRGREIKHYNDNIYSVTEVIIPNSCKSIGIKSFFYNSSIKNITLKGSTFVKNYAFSGIDSAYALGNSYENLYEVNNKKNDKLDIYIPDDTIFSSLVFGCANALESLELYGSIAKVLLVDNKYPDKLVGYDYHETSADIIIHYNSLEELNRIKNASPIYRFFDNSYSENEYYKTNNMNFIKNSGT